MSVNNNNVYRVARKAISRRTFLGRSAKAALGTYFVVLNPFAAVFHNTLRATAGVHTLEGYALGRAIYAMGTMVRITAIGSDKGSVATAIEAAFDEIRQVDKLMSVHDEKSRLSAVNRTSAPQMLPVDARVFEVIEASLKYGSLTGGALDVTVLPLMRLWGFHDQSKTLPKEHNLRKALSLVDYGSIRVDSKNQRVGFQKMGVQIDFGGIAKGYAVDRAAQRLREHEIGSAIINGGGDIYAMGSPPDGDSWVVGITDPLQPNELMATTTLKDAAIATSGNYEQYRVIDGERFGHIIDPKTGLPISDMLSATVVAPTTLEADSLSTASFVLGSKPGMELLQDLRQIEGILLGGEGKSNVSVSPGLLHKVKFSNTYTIKE
jgi:thiamine biosynthesis lipoprotein